MTIWRIILKKRILKKENYYYNFYIHIQNRWLMLYIVAHATLFEWSLNCLWFTLKKGVHCFPVWLPCESWMNLSNQMCCSVSSWPDVIWCSECVCVNKAPWKEFLYLNHFQCFSFPWTSLFIASSKFQGNCTFVHSRSARYEPCFPGLIHTTIYS